MCNVAASFVNACAPMKRCVSCLRCRVSKAHTYREEPAFTGFPDIGVAIVAAGLLRAAGL
jgi:hypothetical protein